jgi:hypothetical protein
MGVAFAQTAVIPRRGCRTAQIAPERDVRRCQYAKIKNFGAPVETGKEDLDLFDKCEPALLVDP